MTKQNTELFLARRLSSSRGRRSGAMVGIARVSVAISMAVIFVALSVVGGFKEALTEKLTGLNSHITVDVSRPYSAVEDIPLVRDSLFESRVAKMEHFASLSTYTSRSGIARSNSAMQGLILRGVEQDYDSLYFAAALTEGRLPRIGTPDRKKELLISVSLARLLEVGVGDKLELLFTSPSAPLRRDSFKVCGIYSTGLTAMEQSLALTDARNVRRINGWEANEVSGYKIMADKLENMGELCGNVRAEAYLCGDEQIWRTGDLSNNYPQIFDWLATHDINGAVIIVIMLAVALLNMITALLIIIFEHIRTIGTLKAYGMRNRSVHKLFLWCGLRVILVGQFWGNLIGGGLLLLQHHTGIIALDAEAYLLDSVPVAFDWGWWIGMNLAIPVVLTLLLSIPVAVTSRIRPAQTIKYS